MIRMTNLSDQYALIKKDVERGFAETIENSSFILGPHVRTFERNIANYLGVKHAIGCASGSDALFLSLLALGIGPGDEVITTAFTFIATAEAIKHVGATPIFVDIDLYTFNIAPENIEKAISNKTKAIVPVHLFGQPANLPIILDICCSHRLKLIEDCAQSFGAHIGGKQTGSFGDAAAFSFYPNKNLGCFGDGGLVATNSDEVADKIKRYRNHGCYERHVHDLIGYNSRLDELQAVVLCAKLQHIDEYIQKRRHAAHLYSAHLKANTPHEDKIGMHTYNQYTILSDKRTQLVETLKHHQIECAIHYPLPIYKQKAFKQNLFLPVTEQITQQCLSLPICPNIHEDSIHRVIEVVNRDC